MYMSLVCEIVWQVTSRPGTLRGPHVAESAQISPHGEGHIGHATSVNCSFVVETYGAFGKDAWHVIDSLCHPSTHPLFHGDFNAWSNPDPKRDFMLSIAFAIQKGNVRMLQRCASRRARSCRRGSYSSRLQPKC